jgi:2-polyprenyl-3-methyl-5-hydroxy-6-metoxy-1,4-benzoquinol methylase
MSKVSYGENYWGNEYAEAVRRENEDCCIRALELIYLSKIPVKKFLDYGCGLGITVNWLRSQLGIDAYGLDKYGRFEPAPYLLKEDILTTDKLGKEGFDAIMSVEVVEHLPQKLIIPIFERLRDILKPGGLILVNTGTLEFIQESINNKGYIDPSLRGHISIFSLRTFKKIADILGLLHVPMWSRNWCTLLLKPKEGVESTISPWEGIEENFNTIKTVKLMYPLIRQSLWAEELNYLLHKVRGESPQTENKCKEAM